MEEFAEDVAVGAPVTAVAPTPVDFEFVFDTEEVAKVVFIEESFDMSEFSIMVLSGPNVGAPPPGVESLSLMVVKRAAILEVPMLVCWVYG